MIRQVGVGRRASRGANRRSRCLRVEVSAAGELDAHLLDLLVLDAD
jgi:hypothetical protein